MHLKKSFFPAIINSLFYIFSLVLINLLHLFVYNTFRHFIPLCYFLYVKVIITNILGIYLIKNIFFDDLTGNYNEINRFKIIFKRIKSFVKLDLVILIGNLIFIALLSKGFTNDYILIIERGVYILTFFNGLFTPIFFKIFIKENERINSEYRQEKEANTKSKYNTKKRNNYDKYIETEEQGNIESEENGNIYEDVRGSFESAPKQHNFSNKDNLDDMSYDNQSSINGMSKQNEIKQIGYSQGNSIKTRKQERNSQKI